MKRSLTKEKATLKFFDFVGFEFKIYCSSPFLTDIKMLKILKKQALLMPVFLVHFSSSLKCL